MLQKYPKEAKFFFFWGYRMLVDILFEVEMWRLRSNPGALVGQWTGINTW